MTFPPSRWLLILVAAETLGISLTLKEVRETLEETAIYRQYSSKNDVAELIYCYLSKMKKRLRSE
ncbi:hypothetical protein HanPSC8_Chr03g0124251 [Helianthus annuus]|nr:hypothetical protein HanPSC8_Chr03g0124251 [Helianthus annuus]